MSSSTANDKKHLTSSSRYDLRHHIRSEKPFSIKTSIRSEKLLSIKPNDRLEKPLSIKPQVLVVDTYHSVKVETPNIHSPVRHQPEMELTMMLFLLLLCIHVVNALKMSLASSVLSVMVPVVNGIIPSAVCTKKRLKNLGNTQK